MLGLAINEGTLLDKLLKKCRGNESDAASEAMGNGEAANGDAQPAHSTPDAARSAADE